MSFKLISENGAELNLGDTMTVMRAFREIGRVASEEQHKELLELFDTNEEPQSLDWVSKVREQASSLLRKVDQDTRSILIDIATWRAGVVKQRRTRTV